MAVKKVTKKKGTKFPTGLTVYIVCCGKGSDDYLMCNSFENAVKAFHNSEHEEGIITSEMCRDQRDMLSLQKLKIGDVLELDIKYKVIKPIKCTACHGVGHLNKREK